MRTSKMTALLLLGAGMTVSLLLAGEPAAALASPGRPAELAEVRSILDAGARRAGELAEQARSLPRGPAREELLRAAAAAKRQAVLDALRARERHARARGDIAAADEFARAIRARLEPRWSAPVSTAAKPTTPEERGGAR